MNQHHSPRHPAAVDQPGFTLVELMVIVAVIGIISGMGLQTMASFLQEQRLRQATFELVAYLQSARARAQREDRLCQLAISGTRVGPSSATPNSCSTLSSLDLQTAAGLASLTLAGNASTAPISFSRFGVLATVGSTATLTLPRMLYLSTSGTSQQRCVFLDLLSIREGWRSGDTGACTYSNG
jgi:type IV fimbrial biogenesis protein FimT